MHELRDIIEAAIRDADELELPTGSDQRMGYVFAKTIVGAFGDREGLVLWERVAGIPVSEIARCANDLQKQSFKNHFGLSLEEACDALELARKPRLEVVR